MTWQPIDTAPKDGTVVDLWVCGPLNRGGRIANCWYSREVWLEDCLDRGDLPAARMRGDMPSHWMPIPEGPVS